MPLVFNTLNVCNYFFDIASKENPLLSEDNDIADRVCSIVFYEVTIRVAACFAMLLTTANTVLLLLPSLAMLNFQLIYERGLDYGVWSRVNMLFMKAIFIGTASPGGAVISPYLIYQNFDSYRHLCHTSAEYISEIPSDIESIDSDFDRSKLPDQGEKLENWRAEFLEQLKEDLYQRCEISETIDDQNELCAELVKVLYNHYTDKEIEDMYGVSYISHIGGTTFSQKYAVILKDAIRSVKNELIENQIYTEDEITSIDPGSYMAIMDHAFLRTILEAEISQDCDRSLVFKFRNQNIVVYGNGDFYDMFKLFHENIHSLDDQQLKKLKECLNHKQEVNADELTKNMYISISRLRISALEHYITNKIRINLPINFNDLITVV